MAIAALTRKLPQDPVRRTAPSLARRIVNVFVVMAEVWRETQEMRREAQRRYPHLVL